MIACFHEQGKKIGDRAELHHTDFKYDSQFVIREFPDYDALILQVQAGFREILYSKIQCQCQ